MTFVLSGCSFFQQKEEPTPVENVIYKTVVLSLPERPTLPIFSAKDVECISVETKQKLIDRDRLRRDYSEQLEAVILSTIPKK